MNQPSGGRVSAQPPVFHLAMRLIDDLQQPMANIDYVLEWGSRRLSGQTDGQGLLDHPDLDGSIGAGSLLLGTGSGGDFVAKARIPVIRFVLSATSGFTQPYWRLSNLGFVGEPGYAPGAGRARNQAVGAWRQSRGLLGPDYENPNATNQSPNVNTGFLNRRGEQALRDEHDLAEDPQGG
jgi:hypothetical protein